jgi:hypothetical protein
VSAAAGGRVAAGPARAAAVLALLAGAPVLPAAAAHAQSQRSERATVGQTFAGVTVRLVYARPQARGRDSVIGRVVHWGETWTPGANWATTLETDRDVLVEGKRLAQGTYSVWAVPRPDRWTVMLSRRARLFHTAHPDPADEALRVDVRPESGPHVEVLTWDFPAVARTGATLRLRWGPVVVPVRLGALAPPVPVLAAADARAPYLGRYEMEHLVVPPGAPPPGVRQVEVFAAGDTLRLRFVDRPSAPRRGFDLVPAGTHRFHPASPGPDGQLWFEREVAYTFTVAAGRAADFEVRREDGTVESRARRLAVSAPPAPPAPPGRPPRR